MLIQADARRIPLVDGCVQCVVTSPPYFGLRDYGIAQQIGLEPSPDAYVAALVAVYQEVWRVLADDGTVWLNLGDSYCASPPGVCVDSPMRTSGLKGGSDYLADRAALRGATRRKDFGDLKPKDLLMIPARVALALQADGWYLRSDIIWAKRSCMPEAVKDRPTRSHEYVFLLTKSARYYYNADAVSEARISFNPTVDTSPEWRRAKGHPARHKDTATMSAKGLGLPSFDNGSGTRNCRSVWTINPKPYAGAHFATMPEKLAERCILAGSRPGDLVFDPFGGSGTTVRVARRFNRRGVMLDLNPKYLQLAAERISGVQPDIFEAVS